MEEHIERLKHEIEELERQIAAHPFDSLFDRKRSDQLYHKLKKKRKELAEAENEPVTDAAPVPAPQQAIWQPAMPPIAEAPRPPMESVAPIKSEPPAPPKTKPAPMAKVKAAPKKKASHAGKTGTAAKAKTKTKAKPVKAKAKAKPKPASKSGGKTGKKKAK